MASGQVVQQERRILNEAIESAYIECAGLASGIRTHIQTGRGTITDLYEDFHYNFGVLFDITSDLEEMQTSMESIAIASEWLDSTPPKSTSDFVARCASGREAFRRYKKALNNCGLISLPSRGK